VGEISGPLIGMALKQENAEARCIILNETKTLICNYLFCPSAPPVEASVPSENNFIF
jgi:hypothetical protein